MVDFKDFVRIENLIIINLKIGGNLGWMKLLRNGVMKSLYFMQLFLRYILFGEHFIG